MLRVKGRGLAPRESKKHGARWRPVARVAAPALGVTGLSALVHLVAPSQHAV